MVFKYFLFFICSFYFFLQCNSITVQSITGPIVYDSPFDRPTSFSISVQLSAPVTQNTQVFVKIYNNDSTILVYEDVATTIPIGYSSFSITYGTNILYESNGNTLKASLPLIVKIEPSDIFTNNSAVLGYYSEYYNHQVTSPSNTTFNVSPLVAAKAPSGTNAFCNQRFLVEFSYPNFYQFYTILSMPLLPIQRNSSYISFLMSTTSPISATPTSLALTLTDLTPISNTLPQVMECPISVFTASNVETVQLGPLFSKSFIVINGDNILASLISTNNDSYVTSVSTPSFLKFNTGYLSYFRLYRRTPYSAQEVISVYSTIIGTAQMTYASTDIATAVPSVSNLIIYTTLYLNTPFSSYVVFNDYRMTSRFTITFSTLQQVDFLMIFIDNIQASNPVYPISLNATYQFPLLLNTWQSVGAQSIMRVYLRNNKYLNVPFALSSIISPLQVSTISNSRVGREYSVRLQNLQPREFPIISSTISPITYNVIKPVSKQITSEFPFRFKGSSLDTTYTLTVPVLSDTLDFTILEIATVGLSETSNEYYSAETIVKDGYVDLLPPMAKVTILYDQSLPNGLKGDFIRVDIYDDIGIDNDKCSLSYGPYKFKLDTSHRIKGSFKGDSSFLFSTKINRYFCDSLISFSCEDLRGNLAEWDSNTIKSLPVTSAAELLNQTGTCQSSSIKLLSIDSTIRVMDGQNYTTIFAFTLQGITNASDISVQMFLQDKYSAQGFQVDSLAIPSTYTPSLNNIYVYTITPLYYPLPKAGDFMYSNLKIKDKTLGVIIEFNYQELQYISQSQVGKDTKFSTSINLRTPLFRGFTFTFVAQYDLLGSITFTPTPGLDNIDYVNISFAPSLYPYIEVYRINITALNKLALSQSISGNGDVWISAICDINGNCENYLPTQFHQNIVTVPSSAPSFEGNHQVSFSRNYIDTTSNQRSFTFNLVLSVPFTLSTLQLPIFYLVESESQSRLSYPMTKLSAYEYSCTMNLPLNWGLRGFASYHVYNIFSNTGYFSGFDWETSFLVLESSKPTIWSTQFNYSSNPKIFLEGSLLGYLEDIEYQPRIQFKTGTKSPPLQFKFINEVSGFIEISMDIALNAMYLVIGDNQIQLAEVETCNNPTCSGNGICVGTTCECYNDWSGFDCSISTKYTCLNDCSGHGSCNFQICNCDTGFMGPSCDIIVSNNNNNNKGNITINTNTTSPTTSFITGNEVSRQTNFTIMLTKIEEIDYQGTIIQSYDLLQENWNLTFSNSTSFLYEIPIHNSIMNVNVLKTSDSPMSIQFANQSLQIPENSIKYYLKVDNYTFSSKLNHLEFTWETFYKVPNPCSTKDQSVTYGGLDKSDIHYIIIPANQLQLYGRFSNLIVVDNRTLLSSNSAQEQDDKVLIKVSVPYFDEYVELDPDFSVLVNIDDDSQSDDIQYDDECNPILDSSSKLAKYVIPVAVVASVVGLALLIISLTVLYKKNMTFKLKLLAIKKVFKGSQSAVKLEKI